MTKDNEINNITDEEILENAESGDFINETDSEEVKSLVKMYLEDIKNSGARRLKPEEEIELGMRVHSGRIAQEELDAGDCDEEMQKVLKEIIKDGVKARDELVNNNLLLVISSAKPFVKSGVELADLIGEGNIALMKAAEEYDYSKGNRFSTVAVRYIKNACRDYARDYGSNTVHMPQYSADILKTINKTINDFQEKNRRTPSNEEIAEILGYSKYMVDEYVEYSRQTLISMDTPIGEDEDAGTLEDVIEDKNAINPENASIEHDNGANTKSKLFAEPMTHLTETQAVIIGLHYGLLQPKMTPNAISDELTEVTGQSISRKNVIHEEEAGLRALYNLVFDDAPVEA